MAHKTKPRYTEWKECPACRCGAECERLEMLKISKLLYMWMCLRCGCLFGAAMSELMVMKTGAEFDEACARHAMTGE